MQSFEHLHCLSWQRHDVLLACFHALRRDTPNSLLKVKLIPGRLGHFGRSRQGPPHQLHAMTYLKAAAVVCEVAQQFADLLFTQRRFVLGLVCW